MPPAEIVPRLKLKLNDECAILDSDEEYYFLLAQLVVASFEIIGGVDKYRKEYNYLTNPSLACNVQGLDKRILHFLSKAITLVGINKNINKAYGMIINYKRDTTNDDKYIYAYEQAFSEGLHNDNILI